MTEPNEGCVGRRLSAPVGWTKWPVWTQCMPAAWSFLLALRSRGLGSVWTTLHLFKEADVSALLGIPDNMTQVALFPVAYTVGTEFKPGKRKPLDTMVHWDTW